ncbi:MAG: NAD(P)H-dependent glycerol-3-phosphate dehydrogenase [Firmicutes bacterium]|nr:NAD(P)H-dependent glycerol-3-phosphate dehydrogenase [Bacillota bacterium]
MRLGIIGAGGWGTALATLLAEKGYIIDFWAREQEVANEINTYHTNNTFLEGIFLPEHVIATCDIGETIKKNKFLIVPVPAQHMRSVIRKASPYLTKDHIIIHAAKGIEEGTLMRMSEVISEELPNEFTGNIGVISGPSHAEEVAKRVPTAIVVASARISVGEIAQKILMCPTLRVYTSTDIIGVELGGALKNVIALSTGISDGLGFGDNTRAAIMTRGIAEMLRLGVVLGADPITFAGLSGMGDVIVTCMSMLSRNRKAGIAIAKGKKVSDIIGSTNMVVEGIATTKAAVALSKALCVEMPIASTLYAVLFEGLEPREAVEDLMLRVPVPETMLGFKRLVE